MKLLLRSTILIKNFTDTDTSREPDIAVRVFIQVAVYLVGASVIKTPKLENKNQKCTWYILFILQDAVYMLSSDLADQTKLKPVYKLRCWTTPFLKFWSLNHFNFLLIFSVSVGSFTAVCTWINNKLFLESIWKTITFKKRK